MCSDAPATTHPHTYFRWLVLLAVTVTGGEKKHVSCIYLTHFIDVFYFYYCLFFNPTKTHKGENDNTGKHPLSVYACSDQLLLCLIDFHLRKMLFLISAKLPLVFMIILTHIMLTNVDDFLFPFPL